MNEQEQIKAIQEQLDSGELDIRTLDQDQQDSIQELMKRGLLKGPPGGVSALKAERDAGERGIIAEAERANQFTGISTPLGNVMTERTSYEMVGDVIGSFAPYLHNRRAIAKDIIEGVETTDAEGNKIKQKYTKPTGKQALRLEKFSKTTSRLADALGKAVNRRTGGLGRAFVRSVSFLETTAQRAGQLARAETKAFRTGDAAASMLRPGARTEIQSLAGGATGAAVGSIAYDLVNYQKNLAANLTMDISELSEDDINSQPFAQRMLDHAMISASNSLKFGLAGTTIGYAAGGAWGRARKSLLGLNTDDAVRLAKKSVDEGIPLSPVQLASEGFGGFLTRNFLKIFGVTPLVGKPGAEKLKENISENVFPKFLDTASSLGPATQTAAIVSESGLAGEGVNLMIQNYKQNRNILDAMYNNLFVQSHALKNPPIIAADNLQKTIDSIFDKATSKELQSSFRNFIKGETDEININKLPDQLKQTYKEYVLLKDPTSLFMTEGGKIKNMTVQDAALYKKFLQTALSDPKNIGNKGLQEQGQKLLGAFELDINAAELLTDLDYNNPAMRTFIDSMDGATLDAKKAAALEKVRVLTKQLKTTNQTYNQLVQARNLKSGQFGEEQILAQALNDTTQINSQDVFNNMFRSAITQKNPQALREFKKLLGADSGEYKEYAQTFMRKLGARHVFDSFINSFKTKPTLGLSEPFDPANIFKEDIMKAENVVRQLVENNKEYATLFPNKVGKETATFVDNELFEKLDKFKPDDKQKILDSLQTSTREIKVDPATIDNFQLADFRKNLGLDDPKGRATMVELYGEEQTKRIEDTVELLTRAVDLGLTDPSTFLTRRIVLSGSALMGAGATVFAGFGGLFTTILAAGAARQFGRWIADPNTTKAALDLYTPAERKAILNNEFKGPLQSFPFGVRGGIIDPTKPLGDYFGPGRARNLSIFLNSMFNEERDKPNFTAENITINNIEEYFNNFDDSVKVPNAEVSPFQLPTNVLNQMYPELAAYRNLSPEDKQIYLNTLQTAIAAEEEDEKVNKQINNTPQPQAEAQAIAEVNQDQAPPAAPVDQPAAPAQAKSGFAKRYSFLFPQDPSGQAIAQQQETGRG